MEQKQISFTLSIDNTDHHEWQGKIKMPDGEECPFQSVLELLKEIDKRVNQEWERQW